jgi:CDP-paratose 2-epimerase
MSRIVDTIRSRGPEEERRARERPGRKGDPEVGVVQYFHIHDRDAVEHVLAGLDRLPVRQMRTAISWCDWMTEGGEEWYDWLLPQLLERFEVIPCFLYTPPALGILPKTSSPPREPQLYGEFVEMVLERYAGRLEHVELWNEPNNYIEWDWTIDPEWTIFAEMVGGAAERAARRGVKPVLGGMSPFDPNWLDLMFKRGALEHVEVVGVHGFPGTWEAVWEGWGTHIDRVQDVCDRHGSAARIWVTECGFSTWAHDEFRQLRTLVELAEAPAERVYWYSVQDLAPERPTLDGFHADERAYHFGLQRANGEPKLLARVLAAGGLPGVREMVEFATPPADDDAMRTLVTGGAGFIGIHLVERLAAEERPVTVLDNLSRPGSELRLRELKRRYGDLIRVEVGDVRDVFALRRCLARCEAVFHLASTVPADAPLGVPDDLDVNLRATVMLLEEARRLDEPPAIVYASSSAVYSPAGPFACAKEGADQYVRDYADTFGMRTCALRFGAVYGPHQSGDQEHGWLGALVLFAAHGRPVVVFGDGRDVRDLLYVDDAVDALLRAMATPAALDGSAFDVGGGQERAASVRELVALVRRMQEDEPRFERLPWPQAEPSFYVSDHSAFTELTGWQPSVSIEDGFARLQSWVMGEPAALLS